MRDYRDAKIMAHTLRDALAAKHCKITVGESLELIARLFGVGDWNTLSALIKNADQVPQPAGAPSGPGAVRFARTAEVTLQRALAAAINRNQAEARVEHLLLSLTDDPDAAAVLKECSVDPAAIKALLHRSAEVGKLDDYARQGMVDPQPAPAFQRVVQSAIIDLTQSGGGEMTGAHLLAAILLEEETTAAGILRNQGLSRDAVMRKIMRR